MSDTQNSDRYRRNPRAANPAMLDYRHQRRRFLRRHTELDHEGLAPAVVHTPVEYCRYLHTDP